MSDAFAKLFPEAYVSRLLEQGVRADGRAPNEVRALHLVPGVISSSSSASSATSSSPVDASAMCAVGRTKVMCTIAYELTSAFPVQPRVECSVISASASSAPSLDYKRMEGALGKVVPGLLSHAGEDLVVRQGQLAFVLKLAFVIVDDDGAVFDCLVHSAAEALRALRLPSDFALVAAVAGEDEQQQQQQQLGQVKIRSFANLKPVRVHANVKARSFCVLDQAGAGAGGSLLVCDPTCAELDAWRSSLSVVTVDQDEVLCVLKQGSRGTVSPSVLAQCLAVA